MLPRSLPVLLPRPVVTRSSGIRARMVVRAAGFLLLLVLVRLVLLVLRVPRALGWTSSVRSLTSVRLHRPVSPHIRLSGRALLISVMGLSMVTAASGCGMALSGSIWAGLLLVLRVRRVLRVLLVLLGLRVFPVLLGQLVRRALRVLPVLLELRVRRALLVLLELLVLLVRRVQRAKQVRRARRVLLALPAPL